MEAGTFAHRDIAFEFGSWLSPEFKLYLITEFQRYKQAEAARGLDWDVRRTLAKVQYRVHTDAVKDHLIPPALTGKEIGYVYANEADLLNRALFGTTAAEWKRANPTAKGNLRDNATMEQLVVLSSLESQNALLIEQKVPPWRSHCWTAARVTPTRSARSCCERLSFSRAARMSSWLATKTMVLIDLLAWIEKLSILGGMQITTENPLDEAFRVAGGVTKFAKDMGLNSHNVALQWKRTRVPADRCPDIEGLYGVTCERLRPDVNWSVIRGKRARLPKPTDQKAEARSPSPVQEGA